MEIEMKSIPHSKQRYPTVGDYWDTPDGVTHIRTSNLKNPDHEFLVLLHELVEQYICKKRGIAEPDIMAFDIMFEKEREQGLHSELAEPGDDPRAPYQKEHFVSETVERIVAKELGINWFEHIEYQGLDVTQ